MISAPWPSPAAISLMTISHSTTGPAASAWAQAGCRFGLLGVVAEQVDQDRRVNRHDPRLRARPGRRGRGRAARASRRRAGALGKLEAAGPARCASSTFFRRMIRPPSSSTFSRGALAQASVANGLRQGDLSAFGDDGFHGADAWSIQRYHILHAANSRWPTAVVQPVGPAPGTRSRGSKCGRHWPHHARIPLCRYLARLRAVGGAGHERPAAGDANSGGYRRCAAGWRVGAGLGPHWLRGSADAASR